MISVAPKLAVIRVLNKSVYNHNINDHIDAPFEFLQDSLLILLQVNFYIGVVD